MNKLVIIDYGMGNLHSVMKKLVKLGSDVLISSDPVEISNADRLILPGVGHFQKAVENIKKRQLWEVINNEVLNKKKPILGICLGMQLMAKYSEEGECAGFGWFDAETVKFSVEDNLKYKIPHIGWNQIRILKQSKLYGSIPELSEFYFVHSYHIRCNIDSDKLSESEYEYSFTSSVERGNIYGVQFHPEKSHDVGEQLLKNFIAI